MKQIITAIVFLLLISSCSDDDNILTPEKQINYREIAYNYLSDNDKESVTIDWRDAQVQQGTYKRDGDRDIFVFPNGEKLSFIFDADGLPFSSINKLIAVSFNTKDDGLLGPIIIIVDPTHEIVIGFVGRL